MGSEEAAVIIIGNIPPNRPLQSGTGDDIAALANECLALANDWLANVLDANLTPIAVAVSATPQNWGAANNAINALGVSRPYVQQS